MLRVILTGCICGAALLMFLFAALAYAYSGLIMGSPSLTDQQVIAAAIKGGGIGLTLGLIVGVILGIFKPDIQSWLVGSIVGLAAWGILGVALGAEHRKILAMLIYGIVVGLVGAILGSILGGVIGVFFKLFNNNIR